ncbi:MAG: putative Serine/Threonine kinase domain protein [Streblomastix strix]|uniref:non-specific serine/threonine protein kinase n=1 Tax=Streblomastix strix TaxID=222440 RepID=A0A5J4X0X8_9EUKA|nr:MAG: putative Serine/Threonine kinase domain protein [Streblomastix strix]
MANTLVWNDPDWVRLGRVGKFMTQIGATVNWSKGNLSYFQLNKLFKPYGAIEVNMKNAQAGSEGGQAFVRFKTQEEALNAQQKTNGNEIGGIPIVVQILDQQALQPKPTGFIPKSAGFVPKSIQLSSTQHNPSSILQQNSLENIQSTQQSNKSGFVPKSPGFVPKSALQPSQLQNAQSTTQPKSTGFVPKSTLQPSTQLNALQISSQQNSLQSTQSIQQTSSSLNTQSTLQTNSSGIAPKSTELVQKSTQQPSIEPNSQLVQQQSTHLNIQSAQQQNQSEIIPKPTVFVPKSTGSAPQSTSQPNSLVNIQSTQQSNKSGFVPKSPGFVPKSALQPSQLQNAQSTTQPKSTGLVPNCQVRHKLHNKIHYRVLIQHYNMLLETPQYDDFEIDKQFFGGAQGKTFLVRHKPTGLLFVMKRVDYLDEGDKKMADEEIAQMKLLSSKYTVRLMWSFIDRVDLYIVTEYCKKGDLRNYIQELQKIPEIERIERVWELFAQIVLGLNFIHSNNVIHRDIKPDNVFIMEDGTARIGDFGLSRILEDKDYIAKIQGTKYYLGPEVFLEGKMYSETDIFATGIVISECLTGVHPFVVNKDEEATLFNIRKGNAKMLPDWVPIEMKKLISRMLSVDRNKRPSSEDLMKVEMIKKNIQIFEERQRRKEEDLAIELKVIKLLAPKKVTIDELKAANKKVKSLKKEYTQEEDLVVILSDALYAVRSIESQDIDLALKSGLVVELSDIARRITVDQAQTNQIDMIIKDLTEFSCQISQNGRSEQTQKLFQMGLIQSLSLQLGIKNKDIKNNIIMTYSYIIKNGWKHAQTISSSANSRQQISLSKPNQSSQLQQNDHIFYQTSKLTPSITKLQSSSFATLPSELQQLLLLPHPYLHTLEKQGTIRKIIDNILMIKDIMECQSKAYEVLDSVYVEGAKLPSDVQERIISDLCEIAKSGLSKAENQSEDNQIIQQLGKKLTKKQIRSNKEFALESISYLAMNKDNHVAIVSQDFIETSIEIFQYQ